MRASGPAVEPGRASVAQIRTATKHPEHVFVLARYYETIEPVGRIRSVHQN
jgi:hypothetical protein